MKKAIHWKNNNYNNNNYYNDNFKIKIKIISFFIIYILI